MGLLVSKARWENTMVGHAWPSYFSASLMPKIFLKWLWNWKWKLKVTFCCYYIYNMSSQLNLLELYLNLKGPKVFRSFCTLSGFWWIFWAYESSGNWTDLCEWTENRARKTNVFENMQVYFTNFLFFMNHFQWSYWLL